MKRERLKKGQLEAMTPREVALHYISKKLEHTKGKEGNLLSKKLQSAVDYLKSLETTISN